MAYFKNVSLEYEKVRYCIRCELPIGKHGAKMSAREYAARKYCTMKCSNRHKADTTSLTHEQIEALREELRYV